MTENGRIAAAIMTRICSLFDELDVTFPEMVSVSCATRDAVYFKKFGDSPEEVSAFGSPRSLPEGLHRFLPTKLDGVSSVIVLTTVVEAGDFSSRWRRALKREADMDPFTIGDPVMSMLDDLRCDGYFSLGGECFCAVGSTLREAYDSMLHALEGVIAKEKRPRLVLIRDFPEIPPEGISGIPESKSLIYRDRALRSGGHRYVKLKNDYLSFEKGDEE